MAYLPFSKEEKLVGQGFILKPDNDQKVWKKYMMASHDGRPVQFPD